MSTSISLSSRILIMMFFVIQVNSIIKITWAQAAQQVFLVAFWLEFWCLKKITIKLMFFCFPPRCVGWKGKRKHFLWFYHGCTAKKKYIFYILISVNILSQNNELFFMQSLQFCAFRVSFFMNPLLGFQFIH